jgi:hypothetical protein
MDEGKKDSKIKKASKGYKSSKEKKEEWKTKD